MSTPSTPQRTTWTAEEIGFLAGGPGRAAEAVLARLMDGGLVRVSREGLVTAVHQNTYGATSPLEAYVLAGLHGTPRPVQQVVQVAMTSHEMGALHQSLVARGVVRSSWGRPRGGKTALRVVLFLMAFASLFVALAVEPLVLVLTGMVLVTALLLRDKGRLTANGKIVVRYAFRSTSSSADAVALFGLRRGKQRAVKSSGSSTSHVGSGCGSYDWSHHSCGGSSSCSSASSCGSSSCSSSSSSSSSCGSSSSSSSCSSSSS
ncbi:TIGR04222 domain-containing membrane protein [Lentzea sp. DG1S-22]|uniref:TIGR04222 domain-containing membrane protein n=1 Tax=Lentzea sp. DG1S-22 TaxID=3108822 RepID=UPI002E7989D2|nr:TIGR04222 domain-containing membrane protein [Lentzea sp. DG1S-22]WVH84465.1 TIGR04222 domain-containing membrane protein [Lentzea sp. DG1S-22]